MIVLEKKLFLFRIKWVYLTDLPCDVDCCDSVRFIHCKSNEDFEGFTRMRQLTAITDLTQDLEEIWQKIDKNGRKSIRRAERLNIKININTNYNEFYSIYTRFQQRKGIYSYFSDQNPSLEMIKSHGTLLTALYGDELLAGAYFLEDNKRIQTLISGSRRLDVDKDKTHLIGEANRLLRWESLKYAKAKGLSEFDWGGLWTEEDIAQDPSRETINLFKLSFGGEPVICSMYIKAYSNIYKLGQHIYNLIKTENISGNK